MSYSGFLIAGTLIGLVEVYLKSADSPREKLARVDDAILLLMAALAAARADYVLLRWGYFSLHVGEILKIWLGGLGWPGAVTGGLLAIFLLGWLRRGVSRRLMADGLIPLLPPLAVACWLGCWMENHLYGIQVPPDAWYGINITGVDGFVVNRFPLQIVAAFMIVLASIFAQFLSGKSSVPGRKVSTVFLGFAVVMLGSTFLQGDSSPLWLGFRYETWFAAGFIMVGLAGYIGTWLWNNHFQVPQTSNTI
jgi:prolipoprotein diacylglyceryltransferase